MKLSDIKGERTLDVIADCIGPIASIAADPQAAELFQRKIPPEGVSARQFAAQRLAQGLPALLKGHKGEIIQILASIKGETPAEYGAGLDLGSLASDLTELLTDQGFAPLFSSPRQKAARKSSGAVSEVIKGPKESSIS